MSRFIPNPSLKDAEPADVLRLIRSEHVGPMTFFQLVKYAGSVKRAIEVAPDLSRRGGRKRAITIWPKGEAERELDALRKFGARIVVYGEADYPRLLQLVPDAPPLLTLRGHAHLLSGEKLVAMVGARNASANGCLFARKLASELGAAGFVTVSGLARGIDASAHRGALSAGTIAVIGGGIDNIYPPENEALFAQIAESGAILSEMPFGARPHARSFPGRNRIIAGMSRGTVVVEASLKSGSLITAEYALDYGRDVFAVPGSPMDPRASGTNRLLRDGATMVESARDVLDNLASLSMPPLAEAEGSGFREPPASELAEDALAEARGAVLEGLSATPTALEDLLSATGVPAKALMVVLLELELAGRLERHPGAKVSLRMNEDYDALRSSR
ncbi:MAG: DNA-processing protein DprA [Alphaproteobacteria bacterium]